MSLVALALGLLAFVAILHAFRAPQVASRIVSTAQDSIGVMADADLSEEEKERRIRAASLRLFGAFFTIAGIGLAALAAPAVILWVGARLGLYDLEGAISVATGWPFLATSTLAAIAIWVLLARRDAPNATAPGSDEVPYSALDKALHAYAFASPRRQRRLGEIESRIYRRRIDMDRATRPVFVTSLPRAGTTILLNALSDLPEFASATYRHMPFTLSPLLWGGFSGAFRKAGERSERAHGDGIEVDFDSPEAFEEMLWMAFWPGHYTLDRILPWSARDRSAEFERFFRTHMAKIVSTKGGATRYLSKNNANVARLDLLGTAFPDAVTLIPLRDPRAQVASLLRQHTRFSRLHAREPFARQYMEGLGHFEFGGALKPIAFEGFDEDPAAAGTADFWLRYWIAAYETVLDSAGAGAVIVDHDALCHDPARHLPLVAEAVGSAAPDRLSAMAGRFRPPAAAPDLPGASPALLARAGEMHAALGRRALRPEARSGRVSA